MNDTVSNIRLNVPGCSRQTLQVKLVTSTANRRSCLQSCNLAFLRAQTELIRATANTQRGSKASEQQQAAVLEAAASLEALNPTGSPGTSPLLNGRWGLLYQGL